MKRILSLLLCSALVLTALTGCSSIFDRSYSSVTPHQEQAASDEDASILRAESYTELVSCVQHFVSMGQTSGTVHVYQYSGDIDADLQTACNEVLNDDPLGAYALDDISYTCARIVSYYECAFTFSFRHSLSDISSIKSAYGWGAIRDLMSETMSNFDTTLTLRTSSFYADTTELYSLAQAAYYDTPSAALGFPSVSITVYPNSSDSGRYRVVEITFAYSNLKTTLQKRAESVAARAAQLSGSESAADFTVATLLRSRLLDFAQYDENGSSSVYNVLCLGSGNSEGFAMSYVLLCRQSGITCQLVQGTLNGVPHDWNIITLNGQSWHMDLTLGDEDGARYTDAEMTAMGYQWSQDDYPVCTGYAEDENISDFSENTP